MRVTVSHNKPKAEVVRAVDRSFDDLFRNSGLIPLHIVNEKRDWQGDTLAFSFEAKMGFMSTPVKGTVFVTDKDLTIDADLGLLEKLLGAKPAENMLEGRIRGLLQ